MSFSQEIRDFVGGFKAGSDAFRERESERRAREERQDRANIEDAADTAEGQVGSYSGAASTALPGTGATGGSGSYNPRGRLPTMAGMNDAGDVLARAKQAVGGIESSDRYDIVGPTHPKYGRALGKYQVMEANLPQWSRDALGREVSADEFLKNPQVQDKIFEHRFGGYLRQTGSVADAASMWHSGRSLAKATAAGAHDSLGTKTSDYARRVQSAVGPRAEAAIADDDSEQPTQFAAEGGRVRGPDEIEEVPTQAPEYRAGLRRAADAPWMSRQVPETATIPSDDEANEVTPARVAIPEVQTVGASPADTVRTDTPDGTQRARENVPLPPQRPSDAALQAPAPARPSADVPTRGNAGAPVTGPGNRQALPDSGAALPGEGMQPGDDAPAGAQPREVALHQNPELTAQASKGALDFIGEMLGVNKAALPGEVPQSTGSLRQLTQNAATPAEVAEVDRTVDPHGQLNDAARAIARLNAGYDYYLKKGEPQKALKYAASMVLYARSHSMLAGQMAQEALRNGNVSGAAQAIVEAHNQLPDGKALQITGTGPNGVDYAVVDTDGNLTDRGRANLDQMMHLATGMSNGSVWLQQMGELTRVLPKAPTASQKLAERKYADKQAHDQQQEAALGEYEAAATPESNEFLTSLTPEQRAGYDRLDPRNKGRMRREWANEQKRKLTESKAESATLAKEKAAQDEQEFSAYANRIDEAQHELDQLDPNDVQNTAAIEAAKAKLQEARSAALKWSEADPGRARLGNQLRGGKLGGSGSSRSSGAGRQAIPLDGEYGSPPKGATKEQKEDAALDAEVKRGRNDLMRGGGLLQPKSVEKFDLTRADVEFRKHYSADLEVQKAVDDLVPKEVSGQDRFAMRHAAEQIAGANDMLPDEAVNVVKEALANGGNFTVTPDGKLQFGNAPPVRLGRAGVLAIAGIVGRQQKPQTPASVSNPFEDEVPAQQRMDAERRAQAERDTPRLRQNEQERAARFDAGRRQELGNDYQPGKSADWYKRAANAKSVESSHKVRRDPSALPGAVY